MKTFRKNGLQAFIFNYIAATILSLESFWSKTYSHVVRSRCSMGLQIASLCLVHLNSFKQGLEVTSTKALVVFPLNDF